MLTDTHTHLYSDAFAEDRKEMMQSKGHLILGSSVFLFPQ